MKLSESEILKCGFNQVNYPQKKIKENLLKNKCFHLGFLSIIKKYYYKLSFDEYSTHLCGFINRNIEIHKCKLKNGRYGWVCQVDYGEYFEIKKVEDILNISPTVSYNKNIGFTYIIKSKLGYKIGKSKNIHNRASIFNVKLPFSWEFYKIYPLERYNDMEKMLHELFENKKLNGEWFELSYVDLKTVEHLYKCLNTPT